MVLIEIPSFLLEKKSEKHKKIIALNPKNNPEIKPVSKITELLQRLKKRSPGLQPSAWTIEDITGKTEVKFSESDIEPKSLSFELSGSGVQINAIWNIGSEGDPFDIWLSIQTESRLMILDSSQSKFICLGRTEESLMNANPEDLIHRISAKIDEIINGKLIDPDD